MSSVRPSASYCFCPGRRHRLCGRLGRCAGFLAFVILGARAALFPVYGVHTPCGWIDEARWRV
ncbi:MAG TPA: hypothetical protein PLQ54_20635, partial [Armatimonadota bacterium]|nr:hypothetical protein [Armatimonadota bacterium]